MIDSEQTRLVRESASGFVRRSDAVKAARHSRNNDSGSSLRAAIAEAGWLAMAVPMEAGGYGADWCDTAALCEELGRGLADDIVLRTAVHLGRTLSHCPPGALRESLLARLVEGNLRGAVEWRGDELRGRAEGDALELEGDLAPLPCEVGAEGVVLLVQAGGNPAVVWLPFATKGLDVQRTWLVDGTAAVSLVARAVRVSRSLVLAEGASARNGFRRANLEATTMSAAALVGVMGAAFELTRTYLCTRVQFGKPIGSFQALSHRAVDQYLQLQLSRDVVAEAARALDGGDALAAASVVHRAKARCSEAAMKITRESIQMHGAIGFTDEYDVGLFLKRAVVLNAWLGNASYHRRAYAASRQEKVSV